MSDSKWCQISVTSADAPVVPLHSPLSASNRSHLILSYLILSYLILSYLILSYLINLILSNLILMGTFHQKVNQFIFVHHSLILSYAIEVSKTSPYATNVRPRGCHVSTPNVNRGDGRPITSNKRMDATVSKVTNAAVMYAHL